MTEINKIKISRPVIVEGKYDKIKLSSILDADIITTDGFGIFKKDEKLSLIRRLAEKNGIIVLTDSDGAGLVIRNYFNSALPQDKIIHLYIPEVAGKERRKKAPSCEGLLGVEGIDADALREIFRPFAEENEKDGEKQHDDRKIGKSEMYQYGFSGCPESAAARKRLSAKLGFPSNISANALLEAVNMLYGYERGIEILKENGKTD